MDKTDLSTISESPNLSIDSQIVEFENSNVVIDEPEENEEIELNDDVDF